MCNELLSFRELTVTEEMNNLCRFGSPFDRGWQKCLSTEIARGARQKKINPLAVGLICAFQQA